jgi:hypothetical protein
MIDPMLRPLACTGFIAAITAGCADIEPLPLPDPTKLPPPPAGEGFQLATDDTRVEAGTEIQDCYFYRVRDLAKTGGLDPARPVNLHRIQIGQRQGTHHFNIFRVRTVTGLDPERGAVQRGKNGEGECFKSPNWADWPLIANSQNDGAEIDDWTFPDGVVNRLEPDEWIMAQTHYVNATTQETPVPAKTVANLWVLPDAEVKAEMGTLFATKQSIRICQSAPKPSFTGSCQINSPSAVRIIGANAHFHSRGTLFDMYVWDGESTDLPPASDRFYRSDRWDDPPMAHSPALDVAVSAGGGVLYQCSYQWTPPPGGGCAKLDAIEAEKAKKNGTSAPPPDCCYTFGPLVETSEHCNVFLYYYPKVDDINCF